MSSTTNSPLSTTASDPNTAFFSCRDIHSYYGESYIVQGVSFDIHEGEIVALLGRNGAGKTSTLRSIARASQPELRKGEIWLDNQPLHTMEDYQVAQLGVGIVPEDRCIISGLSVEENLQLAQIAKPIGFIVEQNAVAALRLADRALILDTGVIVFDGTAQELLDNKKLRHQYLAI